MNIVFFCYESCRYGKVCHNSDILLYEYLLAHIGFHAIYSNHNRVWNFHSSWRNILIERVGNTQISTIYSISSYLSGEIGKKHTNSRWRLPINGPSMKVFRGSWWKWCIWTMWNWITPLISITFSLMMIASHVAHFHYLRRGQMI